MKNKIFILSIGAALMLSLNYAVAQTEGTTTTTTTTTTPATTPAPAPSSTSTSSTGDFSTFYFGARFLPTVTKFEVQNTGEGIVKTSFVAGWGAGGFLGANFSDNIGVQAELLYSVIAQKYTKDNIEKKIELSYINIPLLLCLNTGVSKPVNFNLAVGPQFGINTGSKIDAEGSQGMDTVTAVLAVKPADVGFAYGAGVDIKLASALSLGLGFRGVYGIIDISDNSQNTTTNQYYILDRSHVKTYAGYIGLKFDL